MVLLQEVNTIYSVLVSSKEEEKFIVVISSVFGGLDVKWTNLNVICATSTVFEDHLVGK